MDHLHSAVYSQPPLPNFGQCSTWLAPAPLAVFVGSWVTTSSPAFADAAEESSPECDSCTSEWKLDETIRASFQTWWFISLLADKYYKLNNWLKFDSDKSLY